MGSFSIWHWLIVLLVVVLIFGTKKLRNIGGDVGGAVKSFKDAVTEEKNGKSGTDTVQPDNALLIENDVVEVPVVKTPAKKRAPAKKPATSKATTSAKKTTTVKPKTASASKTKNS